MKMTFKVNNGRTIEVFQARDDGPVYVTRYDSKGEKESGDIISAGDFVTMLNWYRYQKENGNENLNF
ncbi:MAG TPA: hypothetical protein P5519_10140 [Spirochaetia bacterium]|jgi:hypothetical protein|nr:hypothetical protein [Spirochaetia bacterium]